MKLKKVTNVEWSGGTIKTYAILRGENVFTDSIVPVPSLYLISLAQMEKADNSIRATGSDLLSFFQTLERYGLEWDSLSDTDMSGYLYGHLHKFHGLKKQSMERHISSIKGLYAFAYDAGIISAPAKFSYQYIQDESKENKKTKKKIDFDLYNNYLHKDLFNEILANIASKRAFEKERDELALIIGFHCGLRTSEVTNSENLKTKELKNLISAAEKIGSRTITITLIGKGSKIRKVDIPPYAVRKIKQFLEGRRSKLPDGPLICSRRGEPLIGSHCTNIFRRAKNASIGIIEKNIARIHELNPNYHFISKESFSNLVFHSLRHTYATNLVDFCYKHGLDPWQYLPDQLGHSDVETTKTYVVFDGELGRREKIRQALNNEIKD